MKEIVSWQNNRWIPNSKIGCSLFDAHYFFGWAVFESLRTYNHKVFLIDDHIDRLYRSAQLAEIDFDLSKKRLEAAIYNILNKNNKFFKDDEYRIMVFASPGLFRIYEDMGKIESDVTINVTTASRYAMQIHPFLEKGFTGLISSQRQIPSRFLDPKIKSCSRLHLGIADAEAAHYGEGVLPILLDEHGHIAESSGANIGFLKDGKLCLPQWENVLHGCTIDFLSEFVWKGDVIYGDWSVYDLLNSEGIIFTSTFLGVVPCYEIILRNKHHKLKNIDMSNMNALVDGFSEAVDVDIKKQWKSWYEKESR